MQMQSLRLYLDSKPALGSQLSSDRPTPTSTLPSGTPVNIAEALTTAGKALMTRDGDSGGARLLESAVRSNDLFGGER